MAFLKYTWHDTRTVYGKHTFFQGGENIFRETEAPLRPPWLRACKVYLHQK